MRLAVAAALGSLLLAGSAWSDDHGIEDKGATLALKNGRMTDNVGHYSVAIPEGWTVTALSKGGNVKVARETGHPYCWFMMMEPSSLSAHMQVTLFKNAQKSAAKDFTITRERWSALDRESAGFLESRRTTREGHPARAWNVVTVHRTVP